MNTDLKSIFLYNLITEYMKGVSIMPKIYDLEYKEYVSRMVVEEGRKPAELARELIISDSALRRWVKEYKEKIGWVEKHAQKKKDQEPVIYKMPTDYEKELKAERKRNEQLERENRILKKSMHVFTENHE